MALFKTYICFFEESKFHFKESYCHLKACIKFGLCVLTSREAKTTQEMAARKLSQNFNGNEHVWFNNVPNL